MRPETETLIEVSRDLLSRTVNSVEKIYYILRIGRTLISDPNHWNQGVLAQIDHQTSSKIIHPLANNWCSAGALINAIGPGWAVSEFYSLASRYLNRAIGVDDETNAYVFYNDSHSHEQVMIMWNKAIEEAYYDFKQLCLKEIGD